MYLYKLNKSEFFWYDLDTNHRMIYNKDEYAKQPDSQTSNDWPLICFKKSHKKKLIRTSAESMSS